MQHYLHLVRTWTRPKYLSIEKWKKKEWHEYTIEYYSVIKMNEIMPFVATWMDLEIIRLSEVSQRQIYDITYM